MAITQNEFVHIDKNDRKLFCFAYRFEDEPYMSEAYSTIEKAYAGMLIHLAKCGLSTEVVTMTPSLHGAEVV